MVLLYGIIIGVFVGSIITFLIYRCYVVNNYLEDYDNDCYDSTSFNISNEEKESYESINYKEFYDYDVFKRRRYDDWDENNYAKF